MTAVSTKSSSTEYLSPNATSDPSMAVHSRPSGRYRSHSASPPDASTINGGFVESGTSTSILNCPSESVEPPETITRVVPVESLIVRFAFATGPLMTCPSTLTVCGEGGSVAGSSFIKLPGPELSEPPPHPAISNTANSATRNPTGRGRDMLTSSLNSKSVMLTADWLTIYKRRMNEQGECPRRLAWSGD